VDAQTLLRDPDWPSGRAAVDYYFIQPDGGLFKTTLAYEPYFFLACAPGTETAVEEWLRKKYEGALLSVTRARKEDNHLLSSGRTFLQLRFRNVSDLLAARKELLPLAARNGRERGAVDAYADVVAAAAGGSGLGGDGALAVELEDAMDWETGGGGGARARGEPRAAVLDAREYDVPYYQRVAIDLGLRVGLWYTVSFPSSASSAQQPVITLLPERVTRADPVVLAFDIETTKLPLKFPDAAVDQVMMISYMIDGQGYLITNREIVGADIEDFEYTPKEGYEGPFIIFNEPDEVDLILFARCAHALTARAGSDDPPVLLTPARRAADRTRNIQRRLLRHAFS
jgi:DNA polymerase epsilon subunit 1